MLEYRRLINYLPARTDSPRDAIEYLLYCIYSQRWPALTQKKKKKNIDLTPLPHVKCTMIETPRLDMAIGDGEEPGRAQKIGNTDFLQAGQGRGEGGSWTPKR